MKILSVVFIFLALIGLSASAQESESSSKVTFSVTRFDPQDRPPPEFSIKNGGKITELKIPLTYIAGPFTATLRDGKFLDFFQGEAEKPAVTAEIPAAMHQDLLIAFVPVKNTFKLLKIHAPKDKIGGGDYYVINAMDCEIAIKYGAAKPVAVKPGKSTILRHGPARAATLPVVIQQKDKEGKWKLASSENWPNDHRFRNFLFFYTSSRNNHLAIHGISERLD